MPGLFLYREPAAFGDCGANFLLTYFLMVTPLQTIHFCLFILYSQFYTWHLWLRKWKRYRALNTDPSGASRLYSQYYPHYKLLLLCLFYVSIWIIILFTIYKITWIIIQSLKFLISLISANHKDYNHNSISHPLHPLSFYLFFTHNHYFLIVYGL